MKIVPTESVRLYEAVPVDHDSEPALPEVVKHPFLVLPRSDDEYLLIEGTEEFHRLSSLGVESVPIQLADPSELRIEHLRVGFEGFDESHLQSLTARHSDEINVLTASKEIGPGYWRAAIHFTRGETVVLQLRHSDSIGCPRSLSRLLGLAERVGGYRLLGQEETITSTPIRVNEVTARLSLPKLDLKRLQGAADSLNLFPPNIISIACTQRVLNVDFPVSVLKSDRPDSDKQDFLRDLITLRERTRRTRMLEGRVYLMNP